MIVIVCVVLFFLAKLGILFDLCKHLPENLHETTINEYYLQK